MVQNFKERWLFRSPLQHELSGAIQLFVSPDKRATYDLASALTELVSISHSMTYLPMTFLPRGHSVSIDGAVSVHDFFCICMVQPDIMTHVAGLRSPQ
jgi:hypothetical protein